MSLRWEGVGCLVDSQDSLLRRVLAEYYLRTFR